MMKKENRGRTPPDGSELVVDLERWVVFKTRRGVSHARNMDMYTALNPMKNNAKWSFPSSSPYILPVIFGKPVINRPNEGGGATEHHVVEVRDDPVGTAELVVKDDSTEEHPVMPPRIKSNRAPNANRNGVVN